MEIQRSCQAGELREVVKDSNLGSHPSSASHAKGTAEVKASFCNHDCDSEEDERRLGRGDKGGEVIGGSYCRSSRAV